MKRGKAENKTNVATGEPALTLEYWPLSVCQDKRWQQNAKKHDIEQLATSIQRYGFRDPLGYDNSLDAFVEGNGRCEALVLLKKRTAPVPPGIKVKDGDWSVPVITGVNAASREEAAAYAIDHNNLTLTGGSFLPVDVMRMWGDGLFEVAANLKADAFPITMDDSAIRKLLDAHSAPPPDPQQPSPVQPGVEVGVLPDGASAPSASHVRMVQLFLSTETLPSFEEWTSKLSQVYETPTATDTVMRALRLEYEQNTTPEERGE